jgi:DNA repair exonuclease SbcCD nuclease subunit
MKFIHTADLHIDSPLRGLQQYEGAPAERLRAATRQAFDNLVSMAVEEQVDLVVIAGDLFDGQWKDMQTGIWTAQQFRRLERDGIRVVLLRGNHDAASRVEQSIRWPANVYQFPTERADSLILDRLGVVLHGQGFAHREMPDDLVPGYPDPIDGLFNIGVLHTSLTGDPNHDTYAPTREEVLVGRGYHYWALGHVHARRVLRERPFIAFPGNSQGRHVREVGAKGCFLVTVSDGEIADVQFRPTDTLRWHVLEVAADEQDGAEELLERVGQQLGACREQADGRFCAVRVVIRGACAAHHGLARKADRSQLMAEIRNLGNELDDEVWIEKIQLRTSPRIDTAQLRQGSDLMGDLLRQIESASTNDQTLRELSTELRSLLDKAPAELKEAGVDLEDTDQIRTWLKQAEGLLVSQLLEAKA